MRSAFRIVFCYVLLAASAQREMPRAISLIDVKTLQSSSIDIIKNNVDVTSWVDLGQTMLIEHLPNIVFPFAIKISHFWPELAIDDLSVVYAGHPNELPGGTNIVTTAGHLAIIRGQLADGGDDPHFKAEKLPKNTVLIRDNQRQAIESPWSPGQNQAAMKAIGQVDGVRWHGDVGTLTNWNRHISSVDIVSARDWIKGEFDKLSPTSTVLQKFTVRGRDAWNVVATFDAGPGSDIYVVGGHYDSLSENTSQSAPGAEDNATGAAGVLELARIFASAKRDATLIFIAFSGEEQGLVGSAAWVRSLDQATRSRIKQVLTMDMIGYSKDDHLDVLLETSEEFKPLHDQLMVAATHVEGLHTYSSFNPFGSDHMSFINQGISAILTIDYDWDTYPAYHRTRDTIDNVSREMGTAILKMNAGALAAWLAQEN